MNTHFRNLEQGTGENIRVLVIGDHPVEVLGIRAALGPVSGIEVLGMQQCPSVYSQVDHYAPDIIIADFFMFDIDVADFVAMAEKARPGAKILAFTFVEDPAYMQELFRLGIHGYLSMRSSPSEIFRAIRIVAAGMLYVDPMVAGKLLPLFNSAGGVVDAVTHILSEREIEVLKLVAWGLSDKEIGFKLGISIKSVGTYKGRAVGKLALGSRADIVRYAVGKRWLAEANAPLKAKDVRRLTVKA